MTGFDPNGQSNNQEILGAEVLANQQKQQQPKVREEKKSLYKIIKTPYFRSNYFKYIPIVPFNYLKGDHEDDPVKVIEYFRPSMKTNCLVVHDLNQVIDLSNVDMEKLLNLLVDHYDELNNTRDAVLDKPFI